MPTDDVYEDTYLSFWPRVRRYAVPPSMIETATARRGAGDWAGACAAAGVDPGFRPRTVAGTHGRETAARVNADLRRLAPDLLRWHMPRIAPHGVLRPGVTVALARYEGAARDGTGPLYLVARTPPAWADAGQRIGLDLWDASRTRAGTERHPHPRPGPRFRLDLHRHLWDADRSAELAVRSGALASPGTDGDPRLLDPLGLVPADDRLAVGRWAAEAESLLRAECRAPGAVAVRTGTRRLLLAPDPSGPPSDDPATRGGTWWRVTADTGGGGVAPAVLPDAATFTPPDLVLLRAGLVTADQLHPLVAAALGPRRQAGAPAGPSGPGERVRFVDCRGGLHRIGLVDGVLTPLDHDPAEIRREELLLALGGPPLPCVGAVDDAYRSPEDLDDIRERLRHGDTAGALTAVEELLGPDAALRPGALRDALRTAVRRRIDHGLYRAGLAGDHPAPHTTPGPRARTRRGARRSGPAR
ncbi:hypothetical protein AB0G74_07700 [Streptomyces sp. NPDC020875]|uniref:hypothetical protein n=1 Tax=Streptomyces sp. NPDC020875 TaxID=3154898 RepID=UPI0033FDB9DC